MGKVPLNRSTGVQVVGANVRKRSAVLQTNPLRNSPRPLKAAKAILFQVDCAPAISTSEKRKYNLLTDFNLATTTEGFAQATKKIQKGAQAVGGGN